MAMSKNKRDDLLKQVKYLYEECKTHRDTRVGKATEHYNYYYAVLPKVQLPGQADIVVPVCRNLVNSVMAEQQDIYSNRDREAVTFIANGGAAITEEMVMRTAANMHKMQEILQASNTELAKNITRAINDVILRENEGNVIFQDILREACITGEGWVKLYIQEELDTEELYNFNKEALEQEAAMDPNVTIEFKEDCAIRTVSIRKPVVEYVPMEEIYFLSNAASVSSMNYLCHKTVSTIGDLVLQGYKASDFEDCPTASDENDDLNLTRTGNQSNEYTYAGDAFMRPVYIYEHYVKTSIPSNGRRYELWQVKATENMIISATPVDFIPFECGTPFPTSNSVTGTGIVELSKDIQALKTYTRRTAMADAGNAAYGRFTGLKGQYDRRGLMDNRPGGIVEINALNAIGLLPHHSAGNTLQVLDAQAMTDMTDLSVSANMRGELDQSNKTATEVARESYKETLKGKAIAQNFGYSLYKPMYVKLFKLLRKEGLDFKAFVDGQWKMVNSSTWPSRAEFKVDPTVHSESERTANNMLQLFSMIQQVAAISPEMVTTLLDEDKVYNFFVDYASTKDIHDLSRLMNNPADRKKDPNYQKQMMKQQQLAERNAMIDLATKEANLKIITATSEANTKMSDAEVQKAKTGQMKEAANVSLTKQELGLKQKELDLKGAELDLKREELRTPHNNI